MKPYGCSGGDSWVCQPGIHVALFYTEALFPQPDAWQVKENISSWSCDSPDYLNGYYVCHFFLEMPQGYAGQTITPHNKCVAQVSGAAVVYDLNLPQIDLDQEGVRVAGLKLGRDFGLTVTCLMI